jgi:hypothetical protein
LQPMKPAAPVTTAIRERSFTGRRPGRWTWLSDHPFLLLVKFLTRVLQP